LNNIEGRIDNIAKGLKNSLDNLYSGLSKFQYNIETIITGIDRMVICWMVKNFQDIIIVRLVFKLYKRWIDYAKTNYQDMSRKSSVNKIKR
jgi:hypothetical protein